MVFSAPVDVQLDCDEKTMKENSCIYFIPAWYGQTDEFWKTVIDPWYRIRQKIEFDDSLHQVRIFR